MRYEAIVAGVSAGGLEALKVLLPALPASFPLPIIIVQHRNGRSDDFFIEYLNQISTLNVMEAEDKLPIRNGTVYIAPAGYHLLIEEDISFALSADPRVNYSCPSIDVLFESASDVYQSALIGIILTGANADGAQGLRQIKACGGLAIVQDPETAEAKAMPREALAVTEADYVLRLEEIVPQLLKLTHVEGAVYGAGR